MTSTLQPSTQLPLAEFLEQPETQPAREYIDGKIYSKPMPQGEHSILQIRLGTAINELGLPQKSVHAFTELRCTFGGHSLVPDLSVFEWSRIPKTANGRIANKFEISPDWTIEILSPEQSPNRVIRKIVFCLQHGTKLGWFLDPEDESIAIFQPGQLPEFKQGSDRLPVLEVLGDWQLSAAEVFSWLRVE
jgi:Uma2 family endonuclease